MIEESTSHYRAFWLTPITYTYGTAQRVGMANSANIRTVSNNEIPAAVRDDIRSLSGRKVKTLRLSVNTRGIAGGTFQADVAVESNTLRAELVSSASGELIASNTLDLNGVSAVPADARVFFQYIATVEPPSNVTPVLNDTFIYQEMNYLDLEYYT